MRLPVYVRVSRWTVIVPAMSEITLAVSTLFAAYATRTWQFETMDSSRPYVWASCARSWMMR